MQFKNILQKFSIVEILYLEIEQYSYFLIKYIPGILGFVLRFLFIKMFSKKLNGMVWIQPGVEILHLKNITFGKGVGINTGSYINGVGTIEFSDHVMIGSNVTISSGKHPTELNQLKIIEIPTVRLPIKIGVGVWIAAGAVILPGIEIGADSVIGANSVVTKNIAPSGIYAGVPAKLLKKRN